MKVVLLIGNQPRHFFIARQLAPYLAGLVIEERESFVPPPPEQLDSHLRELWERHFAGREAAEERFFGTEAWDRPEIPVLRVEREELNSDEVGAFIESLGAELALSYGVHFIKKRNRERFPALAWNLHGGLSPWYRGVITLFWPSYMLEPQMTGMTVHELSSRLDGGDIIHQACAPLVRGDGVHDLACRAVGAIGEELPRVIERAAETPPVAVRQKSSGKLWLGSDWRAEHLRLIYDVFENRVVDAYLDGRFERREPDLVRQFE